MDAPANRLSDVHGIPEIPAGQPARPSSISRASSSTIPQAPHFEEGDWVWTPSATHGFRRSTIVSIDAHSDSFLVENKDDPTSMEIGGQSLVKREHVRPFFDCGPDQNWADNTEMVHLDDANILENIRRRYFQDKIYTYTANVLLAVNPYKHIEGLYSKENIDIYRGKNLGTLPPHPYAIADTAYRHLLRQRRNQALVISGESGAGKTETAKVTMHYLTHISRTDVAVGGRIQEKIINSNPILESFGNASTVRNQNSSRFGKYNEMFFDHVGSLVFAGMRTYLLESSRVVSVQQGEMNFHVFYEMLAGLDPDYLEELQLDFCGSYKLLHAGGALPLDPESVKAKREKQKFNELREAMASFVSQEEQKEYWELLAALIHLGEVEFVDVSTSSSAEPVGSPKSQSGLDAESGEAKTEVHPDSKDPVDQAAFLLGISQSELDQALRWREMNVKGKATIFCPRSQAQATQTLQSIIKIVYKRLFDKIVDQINATSSGGINSKQIVGSSRYTSIGTLDIYGFERLQTNSFEQLCINLANERLQQFFIEEVLEGEQRVYEDEGLRIPRFPLPDNQPVVVSIESIMKVLNEHSLRSSKGLVSEGHVADVKFCERVHRDLIKDNKGVGPVMALKTSAKDAKAGTAMKVHDGFQIKHYAGNVTYATKGWIEKNTDVMVPDVEALLRESTKTLTKSMVDERRMEASSQKDSVSHKYLANLSELLRTLNQTEVHYIRCFNPNNKREPNCFQNKYVLEQVVQCGTVELVSIMHHGFPNRCNLKDLRDRFATLLPPDFERYRDGEFMWAVMTAFEIDETQWTLGNRRLFLKAGQLRVLENLRDLGSSASRTIISKIRRQFVLRKVRRVWFAARAGHWWLRYIRGQRKRERCWKAFFLAVRVMRWLYRVRIRLYGKPHELSDIEEIAPSPVPGEDAAHSLREAETHEVKPARFVDASFPRVFVALNMYEEPQYGTFLSNEADMRKRISDDILEQWHKSTSESVLLHNGREVISCTLNPKFVTNPAQDGAGEPASLQDYRRVDVHETGRALKIGIKPQWHVPVIKCMCQHRKQKQTFATCDEFGIISVWRWRGTDSEDAEKYAVRVLGALRLEPDEVLQMCFISSEMVPKRITDYAGVVLVILAVRGGCLWLDVMAVYQAFYKLESTQRVDVEPTRLKNGELEVCFLTTAHSEHAVVLGGRGLLKVWQIAWHDHRGKASNSVRLELVEDLASTFRELKDAVLTTCLSVPLQVCDNRTCSDYIVCGDDDGRLYGFKMDVRRDGRFQVSDSPGSCGRFRTNTHSSGVAIRQLIGSYGTSSDAHHKEVQNGGMPYSRFLHKVPIQHNLFYSLADDGWLLAWRFTESGWRSTPVQQVPFVKEVLPCNEGGNGEVAVLARVTKGHVSNDALQLTLTVGDEVVIVEDVQGWAGGFKVGDEENSGWFPRVCVRELQRPIDNLQEAKLRAIAGHASRLLPNLLVFFDQNAGRLKCIDAAKELQKKEPGGKFSAGGA